MQSGEAEREGVVGVGARAECVGRGDDGAQGVGVSTAQNVVAWWIAFSSRATRGSGRRWFSSVGEVEAAADLGEWEGGLSPRASRASQSWAARSPRRLRPDAKPGRRSWLGFFAQF